LLPTPVDPVPITVVAAMMPFDIVSTPHEG
jgi:hypothetical protein